MSWALVLDDLDKMTDGLPDELAARLAVDNELYAQDAGLAFECAKQAGLVSATIAGSRTPSMYGGPDTVIISVHGFDSHKQGHAVSKRRHDDEVRANIFMGPDDGGYLEPWTAMNE